MTRKRRSAHKLLIDLPGTRMVTRMTDTLARKPNADQIKAFYEKKAAAAASLPNIKRRHQDAAARWEALLAVHRKAEAGEDGVLKTTMAMLGYE